MRRGSTPSVGKSRGLYRAVRISGIQKGFTTIELIIVIVVIGILAGVAISKYVDLRRNTTDGVARGVLGALRSQNALIYSQRILGRTTATYTMRVIALSMFRVPTTRGYGFSWTAAQRALQ
jgi:prepilin-type N-terminal cleavage/methylation domain-containing protein